MKTKLIQIEPEVQLSVIEDTQYVIGVGDLDGPPSLRVELKFDRPGVTAELLVLYKLTRDQRFDLTTVAHHRVPRTACRIVVRGVLLDNSFSRYLGRIVIDRAAQQTTSFLQDDVLLLGTAVFSRSDPVLQIEADDVQASHGATVGKLDPSQVYYLMSRGLDEEEARAVCIRGFFDSLLSRIYDKQVRQKLNEQYL